MSLTTLTLFLTPIVLVLALPTTWTVPVIVVPGPFRHALKGTLIIIKGPPIVWAMSRVRQTTRLTATGRAALRLVTIPVVELLIRTTLTLVLPRTLVQAQLHVASTVTPLFVRPTLSNWRAATISTPFIADTTLAPKHHVKEQNTHYNLNTIFR